MLKSSGFSDILNQCFYEYKDTLYSLICYKLLTNSSSKLAKEWFNGSYAQFIYQNSQLDSQRISEFYSKIGEEEILRNFFIKYHDFIKKEKKDTNILIDSTGLPNDINFTLKAINNHNGVISEEVRLIYIVDRDSNYPLYFRYVPGNIVDVSTMEVVFKELKEYNITIRNSIMDAGYFSEDNITYLY
jgi:transposase